MTDQEIKKNIIEKALEYGTPSLYSELFDNLSEGFKTMFNESISERNFGLPIIKYGHSNGNWVVIGTKEIAWQNDKLNFLSIDNLTTFEVPEQEKKRAVEIQPDRMIGKFEYEIFRINTLNGNSYDIWA